MNRDVQFYGQLAVLVVTVFAVLGNVTAFGADTTVPLVSITSPANGATVWGVTTIMASASDAESGIAGVQFRLDGANFGAEDTAAPYSITWNTTTSLLSDHTLRAVARNGASLTRTSSAIHVTVAAAPARLLKKNANNRHLVDQNNVPFLIAGDAPQAITVNVSTNDADMYFANRKLRGFNSVWINLLCNDGTAGRPDGSTYDGILPFTGYLPGHAGDPNYYDLAKTNSVFFARCDWMITQATKYGLVVFLDPIETIGWLRNDGSNGVLLNNGTNACRAYGQFLGNRYKGITNIVWMSGNDFETFFNPTHDAVVTAVAKGIKDTDANHIHTVSFVGPSGSLDGTNWVPIISLNASYTYYDPTYAQVLKDYNRANFLPVFHVEGAYEFEGSPVTTAHIVRRQEYWALLSGAAGQLYGNHYTWTFESPWQNFLDSPGALQMAHLNALFEPRVWFNLVPDQNHTVVTAGYGTFTNAGYVGSSDYATAARTDNGKLVMVYMPTQRTITVDMTKLAAPAHTRWYDPSSGVYRNIAGSPFSNTGTRNFTPPGNNNEGTGDWVLVLETEPPLPVVTDIALIRGDGVISFTTLAGMNYDVLRTTNLPAGVWSNVATNIPGTGGIIRITDYDATNQPVRFYRVKSSL